MYPIYLKSPLRFVAQHYDYVYILSAKYGFLKPNDYIEDYDLTLNKFTVKEKELWADNVYNEIVKHTRECDSLYWHCGYNYRYILIEKLNNVHYVPLDSMGIGKQLSFYKNSMNVYNDLF
jgi:cytoplasmic iron level regulating protein YaaA (DUF328/UPF0246 family)